MKSTPELNKLAERYVWWESVEWSYRHPTIFLAQVMNLACWADLQILFKTIEKKELQNVLQEAPSGIFSYRAWDYWHLKLGLSSRDLPTRPL